MPRPARPPPPPRAPPARPNSRECTTGSRECTTRLPRVHDLPEGSRAAPEEMCTTGVGCRGIRPPIRPSPPLPHGRTAPPRYASPVRLGVLDIGSNTVHLLVADVRPGGRPLATTSKRSVLRLMRYLAP